MPFLYKTKLEDSERMDFLKRVPFFQSLGEEELLALANLCEEKIFEKGGLIFQEGDPGDVLFLVVSGSVSIESRKRSGAVTRLETIGPDNCFGEATLFDGALRSADAVALQNTRVLTLKNREIETLVRKQPEFALNLIKDLSRGIRALKEKLKNATRTRSKIIDDLYDRL